MLEGMPSKEQQESVLDTMAVSDIFAYLTKKRLEDGILVGSAKINGKPDNILSCTSAFKLNKRDLSYYQNYINSHFANV